MEQVQRLEKISSLLLDVEHEAMADGMKHVAAEMREMRKQVGGMVIAMPILKEYEFAQDCKA